MSDRWWFYTNSNEPADPWSALALHVRRQPAADRRYEIQFILTKMCQALNDVANALKDIVKKWTLLMSPHKLRHISTEPCGGAVDRRRREAVCVCVGGAVSPPLLSCHYARVDTRTHITCGPWFNILVGLNSLKLKGPYVIIMAQISLLFLMCRIICITCQHPRKRGSGRWFLNAPLVPTF